MFREDNGNLHTKFSRGVYGDLRTAIEMEKSGKTAKGIKLASEEGFKE